MKPKAKFIAQKHCPQGGFVGYGATWQAARDTQIAVISFGYADGDLSQLPIETRELLKGQCQQLLEEVVEIKGSYKFKNTFFLRIKSLKTYPDSMQQLIKNSKNITTISTRPAADDPFPRIDDSNLYQISLLIDQIFH